MFYYYFIIIIIIIEGLFFYKFLKEYYYYYFFFDKNYYYYMLISYCKGVYCKCNMNISIQRKRRYTCTRLVKQLAFDSKTMLTRKQHSRGLGLLKCKKRQNKWENHTCSVVSSSLSSSHLISHVLDTHFLSFFH